MPSTPRGAVGRPTRTQVVELLSQLVAIDSVNPSLVPGGAGEEDVARFVAGWLRDAGLEVELREVVPGRPNVIGRVRGTGGGRTLLLNAHLDTVGTTGMAAPFEPRVEGDRLYGRGAFDMKSGLAAAMLTCAMLQRAGGAAGDVTLTGVMDEEYASLGTETIATELRADAAIVTEPTGLRICLAHRGFAWMTVETHGRAAHGSRPHDGIDAIAHMGRVLVDLEALDGEIQARPPHSLLGTGSLHASLIEGGQELSSYPARCTLRIERRTLPGESRGSVLAEVRDRLESRGREDSHFHADAELDLWRDPFEVDGNEAVVRAVEAAAAGVSGTTPARYGEAWWMDAALLAAAGIPTVVLGPSGEGAHAAIEWASIESVALCSEILARAALDFTGQSGRDANRP
ncbi:MAG TPA: ArgE/DapE family deacylase [Chloroflexota bacterium]|nr:ArgE/DapE family deacylase [Chloroflexota bacterium]